MIRSRLTHNIFPEVLEFKGFGQAFGSVPVQRKLRKVVRERKRERVDRDRERERERDRERDKERERKRE